MKKTIYKKFTLWESEKEEKWINDMSAQGWQLVKARLLRYDFEQGKPQEYLYKLELLEKDTADKESQSYIHFLKDTGIEVVGECGNWVYLRRKAADGPFETSNNPLSKLTYTLRLYFSMEKIRNLLIVLIAIFLLLSQIALRTDYTSSWFDFMHGFANGIATGSAVVLTICTPYHRKLKKLINAYVKEIGISE